MANVRPAGLVLVTAFFVFGALMSLLSALALIQPGGALDLLWQLNPKAHAGFEQMGVWAVPLMLAVSAACGAAAVGLWRGKGWGFRVASSILIVNLLADSSNALFRHDPRTLIGVPVAIGLLWYLRRLQSAAPASPDRDRSAIRR